MNSIIEAQEEFFMDRTSEEEDLLSSLRLFPGYEESKLKYPVDKIYSYPLADIVITFEGEIFNIIEKFQDKESRKAAIAELYQEDYPIYIKQINPYSSRVEYLPSKNKMELGFLEYLSKPLPLPNDYFSWHEQSNFK